MPRVGERPAGAESGDDLTMPALILAAGDLGCSRLRGRGRVGFELVNAGLSARGAAFFRIKEDGLRESLEGKKLSRPLDRLENTDGSTFSKSSVSTSEALRLAPEAGEMAKNAALVGVP